jgi:hypothetical protein
LLRGVLEHSLLKRVALELGGLRIVGVFNEHTVLRKRQNIHEAKTVSL